MDLSDYVAKTELAAAENKIPDISNLATKVALNNLSNTIPDDNTLVKKSNYDAKIIEVEGNIKKIQTFESSYFKGKNHYDEDSTQNYLIFVPIKKYFKLISNQKYISSWKSKGLSDENIMPYATSDNSLTPLIDYYDSKIRLKFNKSCLKQSNTLRYDKDHIINIYIVYELGASSSNVNDPTIKKCLFGAVTLTKNANIGRYGYSGYGTGFDRRSSLSFPGGRFGQNIIIFGVDMSSSPHIDNKGKDILILQRGPT